MLFKLTISLLLSFTISVFLIPIIIRLSHYQNWYDRHDERKVHDGDIPRIGGVGIFYGFMFSTIIMLFFIEIPSKLFIQIIIFLFSGLIIHNVGLMDDFRNLRPRYKFIAQLLTTLLLITVGFHFKNIYIPFIDYEITYKPILIVISLVWIIGISNAINLIDGIDGFSSVISGIAAFHIGVRNYMSGNMITVIFCAALIGGILGFFKYNRPKASIFMGDSGSLFLGYMLAVLPMLQPGEHRPLIFESSMLILFIPIIDTLFAIARRMKRRVSIATADREHIHHLFLDMNFSNKEILVLLGLYSLILGAMTYYPLGSGCNNYYGFSIFCHATMVFNFIAMYLLHKIWKKKNL